MLPNSYSAEESMSYAENPYRSPAAWGDVAAQAVADERVDFIRKTYAHLAGAMFAFAALEAALLNAPFADQLVQTMRGGQYSLLIILGAFIGVSYLANYWARSSTSVGMQYLGLSVYVVAEAVIFLPLLYMASNFAGPDVIPIAGIITLLLFTGMTLIVFLTRQDFSFLRVGLGIAGLAAMGVVLCSIIFGFSLGLIFSAAMIVFACGWILYDTSNVLHHYRIGQHVAASLALFASVALLFFYVLRLVMSLSSRD
jgi:FtsH-binding integral membrane protein